MLSFNSNLFRLASVAFVLVPAACAQAQFTNVGVLHIAAGSTLYVADDVANSAGASLSSPGTLQLAANLSNTGTLALGGTLRFSGARPQTLTPGTGALVGTLELASTAPAGAPALTVTQDLTVATQLTLSGGLLRTNPGATISLPAAATLVGETTGRYVQGNLSVSRPVGTGPVDFGLGATLNANGQALGTVRITRTAGLQTTGMSAGQNPGGTAHGIDRVWRIEANQMPAAPVALTLTWLPDDDFGLSDFTQARLWLGTSGAGPWAAASAPANASTRSLSATPAALGVFTISSAAAPLPVELAAFAAQTEGRAARLRWLTASEKQNAYFYVERSLNGNTFAPIGRVQGQGNTTATTSYSFLDERLPAGIDVYYRLQQVDIIGTATYSPVRMVRLDAPATLTLAPNPAQAARTLASGLPTGAVVQVFDVLGRPVLHTKADANGQAPLALPVGLAPGVYVVRSGAQSQRLVVE